MSAKADYRIQYCVGHVAFRAERNVDVGSVSGEQRDVVGVVAEAGSRRRYVVRDDQVEMLPDEFAAGVLDEILRLGRKPHDRLMRLLPRS